MSQDSLKRDFFYLEAGVILPMAFASAKALAPFLFKDRKFFVPILFHDRACNLGLGQKRLSDLDIISIGNEQDVIEGHFVADFSINFFDSDHLSDRNPMLFATGPDYCVHLRQPPSSLNVKHNYQRLICQAKLS